MIRETETPYPREPEVKVSNFDTTKLLDKENPLPNDDPELKDWIIEHGELYINRAVIAVRNAVPGETVETWVDGPEGRVLERSVVAEAGQLVAVGVLGEQYIPSAAGLAKNKIRIGQEGLQEGEAAPPLPEDGHHYELYRPSGEDYRIVASNPLDETIYLGTSSGRLQIGVPGGKIAAQLNVRPEAEEVRVESSVDVGVARFIAPKEFAASYRPVASSSNSAQTI